MRPGPNLLSMQTHRRSRAWAALVLLVMATMAMLAAPARAGKLPGELPAHVGRLNALAGDVQLRDRDGERDGERDGQRDGQRDGDGWLGSPQQPLRNWPVTEGDRLRTGPNGRAELRIGSTTVRLDADAELWLQRMDEQGLVLHLQAGSAALRLAVSDGDAFGPVELLTREGRWLPQRPGHYRFDRQSDATQASVWRGELQFEGRDSALTIPAGRRADLWLEAPEATRRTATRYAWATIERDAFADWVARDERQDDAPITARHVPPGVSGWQDLDRHGDWVTDSEHGAVWQPRAVAPGWAPFHDGRWAWVSPWGWTWIDAAPWGFAPFHYGSWVTVGGRWAWSPGPRGQRPRYAPALSAWIGGPQAGVTIRIGGQHRPPPPRVVVPVVIGRPWRGHDNAPVVVVPHHPHHPLPPPRAPVVVVPREPHRDFPRVLPREPDRHDGGRHHAPLLEHRDQRDDHRPDGRADPRAEGPRETRLERRLQAPFDAQPASQRESPRGGRFDDRRDSRAGERRDEPGVVPRPGVPAQRPEVPAPMAVAPRVVAPDEPGRAQLPRPVVRPPAPPTPAAITVPEARNPRLRRDEPGDPEPRRLRDDRANSR